MKNKNVLVTGGAGFIGSNLVYKLLEFGANVIVVDNLITGKLENLNTNNLKFIKGDIRNKNLVNEVTKNVDIIFHLASSVGNKRSIDNPYEDADINVMGTLNILESSRINNVKKIIVSSSAGIFGELKTIPIREDHDIEPDTPYGSSKLCQEKLSLSYAKLYDIDVIALRYFNVFGINQNFDAYGNVIPIFAHNMFTDNILTVFGDGEQTRDFIHVEDVVQANIKAAISNKISGAFNIGSGSSISINHLIFLLKKYKSLEVVYKDKRPGDVKDSLADISKAKELLNFLPTIDFETALFEYLNWFKKSI